MTALLASKIQIPAHAESWISRENMASVQEEAIRSDVLFISAPEGYGKTAFLAHWTKNLDENIAWLTVDETDNHSLCFFRYIVYAVYSACALLPQDRLQRELANANRRELNAMWDLYKQAGSRLEKPVRLVIDDFHHINNPELLEMIQYFVVAMPESLKICFASRSLAPISLTLWHSLFTVTEVRAEHLQLTSNDIYKMQHPQQQYVRKEFAQTEEPDAVLLKNAACRYLQQGDIVRAITHALKGKAYPLAAALMTNYGEQMIRNRHTLAFAAWCYEFEEAGIPLTLDLQLLFAFSLVAEHKAEEADRVTNQMTAENNRKEWNAFTERVKSAAYDYFLVRSYITIIKMGGVTEVGQWLQKGFNLNAGQSSNFYLLPLQFNKDEPILWRTPVGRHKKTDRLESPSFCQTKYSYGSNKLSVTGYYHGIQAETWYVNGYLKEAGQAQEAALLLAHHYQDPGLLIPMYILRCKLYLAKGETAKAHETVKNALSYAPDSFWRKFLHACQALIYLKEQHVQLAEEILSKTENAVDENCEKHSFISLVRARMLLENSSQEAALEAVRRVKLDAQKEAQVLTFIEAAILESVCYARSESWEQMARALQEAMTCSKEYGYTQLFAEEDCMEAMLKEYAKVRKQRGDIDWSGVPSFYVERLVQATQRTAPLTDLLTAREQEVFSQLTSGEPDHKIAKSLSLTEGMLRIHLTSICEKLNVKSRTEAMLKAYKAK
ncbi:LuxR C-terminal-related transcriptional regulator [Sporosarcina sp. P33]|uniref:LuxR C-terminal-related transcriptional regulator n=1 Tax=Sporosarcina sp. P33 TaxID=1930764 RepID=UPI0009C30002|nr:LuxR C-terminal-related transcriptional regulator [Sporosarcina sp. P33]ARD48430.1 hypothetical protein SporoP33_09460 [Sporosarcina sp. P33]